jgi:hypothetical protein
MSFSSPSMPKFYVGQRVWCAGCHKYGTVHEVFEANQEVLVKFDDEDRSRMHDDFTIESAKERG